MLGNLITRILMLGVGYAYPAFQCFKTLEKKKNRVENEELKLWCQYWIIMALLTVTERSADVLISWLPFYCELKLTLIIYLLHLNFSGTGHVYDTMLHPFLVKHEKDIDWTMSEIRARGWDMAILHWQHVAEFAQDVFLQGVSCLATRSDDLPPINTSRDMKKQESARLFSPLEPSTPRSARLSRASPMNRSMPDFNGSHAAEMSPDSLTDFVYVEDHEPEEAQNHHNPDYKWPPNKSDTTDWDKKDSDNDHADTNAAMDDSTGHVDGLKHRLHLRGYRHRSSSAVSVPNHRLFLSYS